ncbi:MAG: beta-ketoacyl-[acyl-carrier-protein] synthase family protein [Ktedonobacteraceae bacterium]|nr:beta-ketoacyl-[acyl-carrier-protein] synthase family protein [Ktedonobacteraceae bacterium]
MTDRAKRRVVVSGLGAITPHGIGVEAFWQATSEGRSSVVPLPEELRAAESAIRVAGVVEPFRAEQYMGRKLAQRSDRMTHFVLVAIEEALKDARLEIVPETAWRVGAVIANTMGGVNYVLRQLEALYAHGPRAMSAYTAIAWLHVANVGQAAIRYGLQGYCKVPVNDTASGLNALGMAYRAIKRGAADVILAGGCEALLHPFILRLLSQRDQYYQGFEPNGYRPFDLRAAGLVLAEGAGICILEEYEHARQRGAPIYGEIAGYGQTSDALGLVEPAADGTHYARAMQQALSEADLRAQDIAYASLDGRARPASDSGEVDALKRVFGPGGVAASVPRAGCGHGYAAAGALDAIAALLTLRHQRIPPAINCEELDLRYEIDLVRTHGREIAEQSRAALVGGRGTGGTNIALILKKVV